MSREEREQHLNQFYKDFMVAKKAILKIVSVLLYILHQRAQRTEPYRKVHNEQKNFDLRTLIRKKDLLSLLLIYIFFNDDYPRLI